MAHGKLPIAPATDPYSSTPPPPTIERLRELFFPARPFWFHPWHLGLALGIAAALFMLFYVILVLLINLSMVSGATLQFFVDIFPGFNLTFVGIIIGIVWSFVLGFVFGIFLGLGYNVLLWFYLKSES